MIRIILVVVAMSLFTIFTFRTEQIVHGAGGADTRGDVQVGDNSEETRSHAVRRIVADNKKKKENERANASRNVSNVAAEVAGILLTKRIPVVRIARKNPAAKHVIDTVTAYIADAVASRNSNRQRPK